MLRIPLELSVQGLKRLLFAFQINTEAWGTGESFTVDRLLMELEKGESFLRVANSGELERVLRVAKLLINDPDRGALLEDYQILPDGRRRDRQQTPGGKIGANEEVAQAVIRELHEELHLTQADYKFWLGDRYEEEKPSKSYPNLRSVYELYPANITLSPHIKIEDGHEVVDLEDGKRRLFFKWSGKQ